MGIFNFLKKKETIALEDIPPPPPAFGGQRISPSPQDAPPRAPFLREAPLAPIPELLSEPEIPRPVAEVEELREFTIEAPAPELPPVAPLPPLEPLRAPQWTQDPAEKKPESKSPAPPEMKSWSTPPSQPQPLQSPEQKPLNQPQPLQSPPQSQEQKSWNPQPLPESKSWSKPDPFQELRAMPSIPQQIVISQSEETSSPMDLPDFSDDDLASLEKHVMRPEPKPWVPPPKPESPEPKPWQAPPEPRPPEPKSWDKLPDKVLEKLPELKPEPTWERSEVEAKPVFEFPPVRPLVFNDYVSAQAYLSILDEIKGIRKSLRQNDELVRIAVVKHEQLDQLCTKAAAELDAFQEALIQIDEQLFEVKT